MNFALSEMPLPLRFRPEKPMSDEELMRFCAANDAVRVERDANGEILVKPVAGCRTSRQNVAITSALGEWSRGDGRGYAFANAGFTLRNGSMLGAYAAWIGASRWDALSESDKERFSHICPEFIIELRSANDSLTELHQKMEQWIANGVQQGWLIDPENKTVSIYHPGEQPEILRHPTSIQGSGVMAGFELVIARIWN